MRQLEDAREAGTYLLFHEYEVVREISPTRLAYQKGTGDGSWEEKIGWQNGWVRQEPGDCCLRDELNRRSRYCLTCGTGINGTVSWVRDNAGVISEVVGAVIGAVIQHKSQNTNQTG